MKKIIIPRRDHEVYFIPLPEALKSKPLRPFVSAQMERLHPGFSGETALDIKRFVLKKTQWVMATVMEAETLAEYRILHKGCVFFTNTSIAFQKKGFSSGGVQTIGDELIGFDSEKDSPVSTPFESAKAGGTEGPSKTVKNIPRKCAVFSGRIPALRVTTIIVCAALLTLIPLFLFSAAKESKAIDFIPFTAPATELTRKQKYPPEALEILSEFSAALVGTGGKITRWQYNESLYDEDRYYEESGPLVIIETRGIDVLSLRKIVGRYNYIALEDIADVRYIDGEPYLTVFLNAVRKEYLAPPVGTFFSQNFSLPIFSDLTGELRRNGISVVSETLPSVENGNALYTLTYTAKDTGLIRSMEIITAICDKYPVRVKGIDISISGESSRFTVVCSLSQSDTPRYAVSGLKDEKAAIPQDNILLDVIPKAFGYREAPPPPPPPKAVVTQPQAPQARKPPEVSIVGTIRDDRGQMLFYREAGNNKIMTKDTP